jgi:hypothetical protein
MARNNYSAGKRQRELDKARTKQQKPARTLERNAEATEPTPVQTEPTTVTPGDDAPPS